MLSRRIFWFLVPISVCIDEGIAAYRDLLIIVKSVHLVPFIKISWLREVESTRTSESSSIEGRSIALIGCQRDRAYKHNPWQYSLRGGAQDKYLIKAGSLLVRVG